MDIQELTAMVVRHDEHLRAVNGDISEIKEQLRWFQQQQVAAYCAALWTLVRVFASLVLGVVQMLR